VIRRIAMLSLTESKLASRNILDRFDCATISTPADLPSAGVFAFNIRPDVNSVCELANL